MGACAVHAVGSIELVILPNYGLPDNPNGSNLQEAEKPITSTSTSTKHEKSSKSPGGRSITAWPFVLVLVLVLVIGFSPLFDT
ncbi:MAG: hypothetical protein EHM18_00220 [Acidobacteria bacterium]|nr:MAG: hypothetical protein EHM18_00220 [Acidobacteriota bacterium]